MTTERNAQGVDVLAVMDRAVKIERTCPRCRARRYHFIERKPGRPRCCCAECSHTWNVRLLARDGFGGGA